jgi:hypothetical protein
MNRVQPYLEAQRWDASAAAQVENLCYEKVARGCPCPGDGVAGRAKPRPIRLRRIGARRSEGSIERA